MGRMVTRIATALIFLAVAIAYYYFHGPGPTPSERAMELPWWRPLGLAQSLDWAALARPNQTVVVYMGLVGLEEICRELRAHGLGAETPAALVERGTLPDQRVIDGTLATLPERVAASAPVPPALLIVGEVVGQRSALAWYGAR